MAETEMLQKLFNSNENTTEIDITKICRICVEEKPNLVNIKQTFESRDKRSTLKDIFNDCSPVQIQYNDGYPERFCIGCLSDLLKTYEFRQKCLHSIELLDAKLLQVQSEDEGSIPETVVVKKRKFSEIEEASTSKVQKKAENIDFENIIVKNEIIFQNSERLEDALDGVDDEEIVDDLKYETEASTSGNIVEDVVIERFDVAGPLDAVKCKKDSARNLPRVILQNSKQLPLPEKLADHPDLGEFKLTVMRGYKNSSHVVFEANGFLYVNTRNTTHRRYLRCSTNRNCPGKACIDVMPHNVMEEYLYAYRLHNHPKDTLHITKLRFLEEMRMVAGAGNYSPKQVYEIAIKKYPDLRTVMPYSTLSSRLYRLSTGASLEQNQQIDSLKKFAVYLTNEKPKKYCQTISGQQFFQEAIIDEEKETCAILYANTQLIENMSWSNELFVDSSFTVNFDNGVKYYFLTICISVNEHRFPVFFAIMEKVDQEEYTKVLTLFKDKYSPSLHPQEIVTDFNADIFKALTEVYKHSTISGSLLHYIFYIYKQCNVENIVKQIELRTECMKIQSCIFSLPILPPQIIPSALEHLKTEATNAGIENIFKPIFEYIEEVWINNVTPQVFSAFCNLSSVNENLYNTYKKMRDIITSNKKFGFFDVNEKLTFIEDWVAGTYQKVLYGEKLPRQFGVSKFAKVLNRLWQPNQIQKGGFHNYFETVGPLIEKLTVLIWIWGFYNYEGNNDEALITPRDYFGSDVPRQIIAGEDEEEDNDEEVVEEDEDNDENKGTVITLQLIKPGVIMQEEN